MVTEEQVLRQPAVPGKSCSRQAGMPNLGHRSASVAQHPGFSLRIGAGPDNSLGTAVPLAAITNIFSTGMLKK
jgi:hypothetical protein